MAIGAVALAALLTLALASRAEAYVYWGERDVRSDDGTIGRANLGGTGADQSFIAPRGYPCALAVDDAHIYWMSYVWGEQGDIGRDIGRANLDGTGVDLGFIRPADITAGCGLAVGGGHIYWVSKLSDPSEDPAGGCLCDPGTGAIGRANLNGTGVDERFITGITFPAGEIAADVSHIYWTSYSPDTGGPSFYGSAGRIGRARLDGTSVKEDFIVQVGPVDGVTDAYGVCGLAIGDSHLWWGYSQRFFGGVVRANLDGTGAETIIGGEEGFGGVCEPAVDERYLYYEGIWRANHDGSGEGRLIRAEGSDGLAVDALGPPPSNDFRITGARRNRKRGTAKLTAKVPGIGELDLAKTKRVKADQQRADAAGKERLRIKPRRKAKQKLAATGKAKVNARVTYTPGGGEPDTKGKKIKLVKR